ncbi:pigment epithelium-derived factor-like [Gastrophryne carolinensis]
MKNIFVFLLAIAIFSFTSSQDAAEETPTTAVEEEEDPFYKSPVNKLASSASNFGYDLFRAQANKNPTSNLFMSPLTFASALSALSIGAGQRTESLIHRTLYYDLLNNPEVHTTYKDLLTSLSPNGKGVKSIFRVIMERRLRMRADFMSQMEKLYGCKPRVLSGNSRIDLSEANDFVQKRTDNKIGKVFKEIPAGVSILLLGAAYFKGQWVHKFNPRETVQGKFYTDEQTSVLVPMMTLKNIPVRYGLDSDFNCRIMQLPLTGKISAMYFLPLTVTQNLTLIEEGLTSEFVHDIDRALQSVTIQLSMPKLKVDYEAELSGALQDIKLQPLFSTPDFSKISSKAVKLTQVVHKAVLELNEDGLQDAPKVDPRNINHFPLEFHLDHPFLFVVRNDDNGALLFIGKVMDPKGLSA